MSKHYAVRYAIAELVSWRNERADYSRPADAGDAWANLLQVADVRLIEIDPIAYRHQVLHPPG
jgi:hypothetical protein